jgi:uncharacterized protein DUF6527
VNAIANFLSWLRSTAADVAQRAARFLPWRKPKLYRAIRVEEFPDSLEKTKVYLAGEGENLWAAAMVCPCGCGDVIELNLLKQARPCWNVQLHSGGIVSLAPSVWRQKGCRSHFWLRHGRIDWC